MLKHVFNAARVLIVVDAVLSWFMPANQFPRALTKAILDPIYDPVRRVLPHPGGVDLTPLLALGLIYLVEWLVQRATSNPSDL